MKYSRDIIYLLLMAGLTLALISQCSEREETEMFYKAAFEDTIKRYTNKYGEKVTENKVLVGSIQDLKKLDSSKDSTIKELQKRVNSKTSSVVYIASQTSDTGTTKTDTVYLDRWNRPVYVSEWNERWSKGKITAGSDSIKREVTMFNEYIVSQEWKRDGLFKPKYLVLAVTNKNPYTTSIDQRSFTVRQPKHRRLESFLIGVGVGVATGFIIK